MNTINTKQGLKIKILASSLMLVLSGKAYGEEVSPAVGSQQNSVPPQIQAQKEIIKNDQATVKNEREKLHKERSELKEAKKAILVQRKKLLEDRISEASPEQIAKDKEALKALQEKKKKEREDVTKAHQELKSAQEKRRADVKELRHERKELKK